ncbi:MAG TPA: MFS transporter [Nitrososphaerales archaeon]|nr:MFS transporter [Nitrososphaerales archaeon]
MNPKDSVSTSKNPADATTPPTTSLPGGEVNAKPQFDLSYANRILVLFALLAASVMYIEIMLTPSLPEIQQQYGVTSAQVSLVLALYTVFGTAINPIVGKLGDIYGKKKILTIILVCYSVMVTLTSFAPNFNVLLVSRTFQGIGLGIFPLAFSLVREQFPRELVPKAQGLLSAMFGAGLALGLPLGAFVANDYGWQTNYHIATPFVIALTVLIVITVRESVYRNIKARMDYVGAGVLGVSLALIVLALSEGSAWGWTSAPVLGMIVVGVALLVPLFPFERRMKENAVLNFRQLSIRNVLVSNIIGVIVGMGMLLSFQSIVFQLEDIKPAGYGFDIFTAGLYLLPLAIVMLIVTYPVGVLISRIGVKPFLIAGSVIGSIGFVLISTATTAAQIPEYLSVASVGLAMLMVSMQNLLVLTVKPSEMGLATSMNTVFRNVGSSLGAPIAGSILSTFTFQAVLGRFTIALPTQAAFQYTYYIAAITFVFSLIASLFAHEVMGKRAKEEFSGPSS